ncbi:MAG: hypothetical protein M1833_000202 [Piccolia ochrophora]|nr:MAG: hypothetical protein M1833_000202 [Piccolia ochrophora]
MATSSLESRADHQGFGSHVLPFNPVSYSVISALSGCALYIAIEINIQVLHTFKRRRGLYFWTVLGTSWGIVLHTIGSIFKYLVPGSNWVGFSTAVVVGCIGMDATASLVLYSRLHLVIRERKILRFVLLMIIGTTLFFHVPNGVLIYATNSPDPTRFKRIFGITEKIQVIAFSLQETTISSIYIWGTLRMLKPSFSVRTKTVMWRLIAIMAFCIVLDLVLLVTVATRNYIFKAALHPFIYGVKLKLEFVVINEVMAIAARGLASTNNSSNAYSRGSCIVTSSSSGGDYEKPYSLGSSSDESRSSTMSPIPADSKDIVKETVTCITKSVPAPPYTSRLEVAPWEEGEEPQPINRTSHEHVDDPQKIGHNYRISTGIENAIAEEEQRLDRKEQREVPKEPKPTLKRSSGSQQQEPDVEKASPSKVQIRITETKRKTVPAKPKEPTFGAWGRSKSVEDFQKQSGEVKGVADDEVKMRTFWE